MVLTIVDRRATPRRGDTVKLDHPAGPLADLLWPEQLQADAAGVVQIEGLSTGRHHLTIAGSTEVDIDVPDLQTTPEVAKQIVVDR